MDKKEVEVLAMKARRAALMFANVRFARIIVTEDVPTMAVDQYFRLYVNPNISYEPEELVGIIIHEMSHLALRHFERAKDIGVTEGTATLWNLATDATINEGWRKALAGTGYRLPQKAIFPETIKQGSNLTSEERFKLLLDRNKKEKSESREEGNSGNQEEENSVDQEAGSSASQSAKADPSDSGDSSRQGSSQPDGVQEPVSSGEPSDDGADDAAPAQAGSSSVSSSDTGTGGSAGGMSVNTQSGEGDSADDGQPGSGGGSSNSNTVPKTAESSESGSEGLGGSVSAQDQTPGSGLLPENELVAGGSCADGIKRPWELDRDDPENPGLSDTERDLALRKIERDIRKAISEMDNGGSRECGHVPGFLAEEFGGVIRPRRSLKRLLRRYLSRETLRSRGAGDFSYEVLHRRQEAYGSIRLPAAVRTRPKKVGIVLDTSASMDYEAIRTALAEIDGVISALGTEIWVVCCDVVAYPAQKVRRARDIKITGRGGTRMTPGIKEVDEKGVDLIVTITDGHMEMSDWPKECRADHVTCLVGKHIGAADCKSKHLGKIVEV